MSKEKKTIDLSKLYPLFFTIIFIVIMFQYSFTSVESVFYDLRARFDWGVSFQDNIVLITMDEESDEFLGETYPYTYASHHRLLSKLSKDKPFIINYLVTLFEPKTERDKLNQQQFSKEITTFTNSGGIFRFGSSIDSINDPLPPKQLAPFGHSFSLIHQDSLQFSKDHIVRRAILNSSGEDSLHLWNANQFRHRQKLKPLNIGQVLGAYYVRKTDATYALFRYYTSPLETKGRIKKIPFHRVVVGNFPKGFFTNRIILLGSNYISKSSDSVLTPFNREQFRSPKLMIHAEIIQALIQNKTILQVSRTITYILSVLIAIFLSFSISRLKPTHGLIITVSVMLGILFISYLLFCIFGLWLYVTHLIATVFVVYYIWVPFRAIAEYQRRYAIQEESKLVKKVESLKQNFISLMSHDLKTPVAKIAGLADVMLHQNKHNDAVLEKNLHSIIESTRELNKFITSILDLTKIESRNLALNLISKDVNTILENTLEGLKYEATVKNIEFQQDLAPLYPIQCDIDLIKRVLANLIENAIKYSGENSTIKIKSWDDQKWVYIEIADNGVGIPPEDLKHVFEKFYRVKNDASHKIKGTGLGLFLVKYFVELHGGQISAQSTVGQGTIFQVKLKNR